MTTSPAVAQDSEWIGARRDFWSYRTLIWNFARRDLKTRYRGTFLGWIWSLVLPLATLMVYTVVFSVVFRAQPPPFGNGRTGIYSVWLFVGLVAWQFLAHGINTAVPSLMSAGRLLQKIYIPSYVPVIGSLVATALQSAVELGLVLLILLILGNVGVSWLVLPVILAFYFVFVTSVSLALSIMNVYMRDLRHVVAVVLQLLFFASAVLYPVDQLPEEMWGLPMRDIMSLNPAIVFIGSLRDCLYGLQTPGPMAFVLMAVWSAVAVGIAVVAYRRKGQDIGESV